MMMIDAASLYVGVIIGLCIGVPLGVGCAWRYLRERARREHEDRAKELGTNGKTESGN